MKRLLLILCALPLGGCFDRPDPSSAQFQHFKRLDSAGIAELSGTESRDPRPAQTPVYTEGISAPVRR